MRLSPAAFKHASHKRIKPKYNPRPNAAEKRHRDYVKEHLCFGCGAMADDAHHTKLNFPSKRFHPRDHLCLLPLCRHCHAAIHDRFGNEEKWLASVGKSPAEAIDLIERLRAESDLIERMTWNG